MMRIGDDRQIHLGYCTNVFPAEGWADTFEQLRRHLPGLKARLSPDAPFGVGLRLANAASLELEQPDRLAAFRDWLAENGLYVFTLNGFPYGGFHREVVKDAVYRPDWTEPARLEYTLRLARLLSALLPQDLAEGSVSTVPLSYKPWFEHAPAQLAQVRRACCAQLAALAVALERLADETGKRIHVDLEPEPDCVLEQSEETVRFFTHWLWPVGGPAVARSLGISVAAAQDLLRRSVGVCYDTCHFAVGHERPGLVISRLRRAGVRIGKTQLSSALKVPLPAAEAARRALARQLRPFAESTYLHQVVGRGLNGLYRYPDLPAALENLHRDRGEEWRIHFHVPIFSADSGALGSTQDDIVAALPLLQAATDCRQLEIETYTWEVLPPGLKSDLDSLIRREYEWVLGQLAVQQAGQVL
jgi:hypothetical protein